MAEALSRLMKGLAMVPNGKGADAECSRNGEGGILTVDVEGGVNLE